MLLCRITDHIANIMTPRAKLSVDHGRLSQFYTKRHAHGTHTYLRTLCGECIRAGLKCFAHEITVANTE